MHATTSKGDTEDLLKCLKKETPLLSLHPHSRSGIRRAPQTLLVFSAQGSLQDTIQACVHGRTEIQTAFLLHELHVLPIYLWFPRRLAATLLHTLEARMNFGFPFCNRGSITHFRSWTTVDILTFVTWWLKLQQHGSVGSLSWRKRLLPTH